MADNFDDEINYIHDDYEHLNPDLFYTVTRVISEDLLESGIVGLESGCTCAESRCTLECNCTCLKYGINYRSAESGGLVLDGNKFGNNPVFECNFQCSCYEGLKNIRSVIGGRIEPGRTAGVCTNRNVQFGPIENLEIFDAGRKGLGLKTRRQISRGSFICEYAGEVISLKEAKKREANRKEEMNYLFVLREHSGDTLTSVTCVDPTRIGNVGRYINHSCRPNSAIVPVRVNDFLPLLCVFAIRDIEADEEICYDYSGGGGGGEECVKEEIIKEQRGKRCLCGASDCRKFLPFQVEI